MRWQIVRQTAVVVVTTLVLSTPSLAGTGSGGDTTGRHFMHDAVERIYAAAQLADMGREQSDPIPLLAAARLVAWASPWPHQMSPEITGGEPDVVDPGHHPPVTEHTSLSLLMEARALAGNDQQLLSVIDASRVKNEKMIERSGNGGLLVHKQLLRRHAKATFRIVFNAREPALVAIVGTSGANLDLVVLDEKNTVVCERPGWSRDYQLCDWRPASTAAFSVVVTNSGNWANEFTIYTN